uniref:Uncharacterized protein n=1 Tax=Anguilla anguilla TaxID=7936 RepID=A0A0E9WIS0_ANGAN
MGSFPRIGQGLPHVIHSETCLPARDGHSTGITITFSIRH